MGRATIVPASTNVLAVMRGLRDDPLWTGLDEPDVFVDVDELVDPLSSDAEIEAAITAYGGTAQTENAAPVGPLTITTETFDSYGRYVIEPGLEYVEVMLTGGGGGGGVAIGQNTSTGLVAAGGGGASATIRRRFSKSELQAVSYTHSGDEVVDVVVGGGGLGGRNVANSQDGQPGGSTIFGGLIEAGSLFYVQGGLGGQRSINTKTLLRPGGAGRAASPIAQNMFAVSGGAGGAGRKQGVSVRGGSGGASFWGGGALGGLSAAGASATAKGAGGGGAAKKGSGAVVGGAGAPGRAVFISFVRAQ